jgi:hypothetical protein
MTKKRGATRNIKPCRWCGEIHPSRNGEYYCEKNPNSKKNVEEQTKKLRKPHRFHRKARIKQCPWCGVTHSSNIGSYLCKENPNYDLHMKLHSYWSKVNYPKKKFSSLEVRQASSRRMIFMNSQSKARFNRYITPESIKIAVEKENLATPIMSSSGLDFMKETRLQGWEVVEDFSDGFNDDDF